MLDVQCNYIIISSLDRYKLRLHLPAAICDLRALAKLLRFANEIRIGELNLLP